LITLDARALERFAFLPADWPAMSLEEARARAQRRREMEQAPRAAPIEPPPASPPEPQPPQAAPELEAAPEPEPEPPAPPPAADPTPPEETAADQLAGGAPQSEAPSADDGDAHAADEEEAPPPALEPAPAPAPLEAAAPPPAPAASEAPAEPERARAAAKRSAPTEALAQSDAPTSRAQSIREGDVPRAQADATAFAPKKLRRGTPELVRIVIHQPKQLRDVIKAARKIDPQAEPAPQSMGIGEIALGAHIGVALEVRGAACEGALQRRRWNGEPIDFSFTAEAEDDAKQAVFLARVFVDDAQIGVLAFTRKIIGAAKKPASTGDVRLKRHKRVFLSYSSADRETVSAIATAYAMAGVAHFWDRTSLQSGEEWGPRLRREIDRADLFHLCWSKAAAQSEWVDKEATHALQRRRRSRGKTPDITVQMLDGPPWAAHPPHLDSINFDDFVRAAIVGYARGDGQT
ncbi:MAG: toll/interleukin-1 receptor domain-containing protein, partial [Hyphomonadaceae bacterium]|nr:toll/interleukin-1 receptor domain-containing protein [Hyphomonadaceae bacterium]